MHRRRRRFIKQLPKNQLNNAKTLATKSNNITKKKTAGKTEATPNSTLTKSNKSLKDNTSPRTPRTLATILKTTATRGVAKQQTHPKPNQQTTI
ncbi:MAG: hypothetical protein QXK84_06065 [Nitrososphaerota archaeon]